MLATHYSSALERAGAGPLNEGKGFNDQKSSLHFPFQFPFFLLLPFSFLSLARCRTLSLSVASWCWWALGAVGQASQVRRPAGRRDRDSPPHANAQIVSSRPSPSPPPLKIPSNERKSQIPSRQIHFRVGQRHSSREPEREGEREHMFGRVKRCFEFASGGGHFFALAIGIEIVCV